MGVAREYCIFLTAAGWMGAVWAKAGLSQVVLPRPAGAEVLGALRARFSDAQPLPQGWDDLAGRLQGYWRGEVVAFPDAVDTGGATAFQRAVWEAARAIPRGETRSYGELAARLGRPGAARAVGQALGANPWPIVVPCHRVVGRDGLGGFAGGQALKRRMLALEEGICPAVSLWPERLGAAGQKKPG